MTKPEVYLDIQQDLAVGSYVPVSDQQLTDRRVLCKSRQHKSILCFISAVLVPSLLAFLIFQCALQINANTELASVRRRLAEQAPPCQPRDRRHQPAARRTVQPEPLASVPAPPAAPGRGRGAAAGAAGAAGGATSLGRRPSQQTAGPPSSSSSAVDRTGRLGGYGPHLQGPQEEPPPPYEMVGGWSGGARGVHHRWTLSGGQGERSGVGGAWGGTQQGIRRQAHQPTQARARVEGAVPQTRPQHSTLPRQQSSAGPAGRASGAGADVPARAAAGSSARTASGIPVRVPPLMPGARWSWAGKQETAMGKRMWAPVTRPTRTPILPVADSWVGRSVALGSWASRDDLAGLAAGSHYGSLLPPTDEVSEPGAASTLPRNSRITGATGAAGASRGAGASRAAGDGRRVKPPSGVSTRTQRGSRTDEDTAEQGTSRTASASDNGSEGSEGTEGSAGREGEEAAEGATEPGSSSAGAVGGAAKAKAAADASRRKDTRPFWQPKPAPLPHWAFPEVQDPEARSDLAALTNFMKTLRVPRRHHREGKCSVVLNGIFFEFTIVEVKSCMGWPGRRHLQSITANVGSLLSSVIDSFSGDDGECFLQHTLSFTSQSGGQLVGAVDITVTAHRPALRGSSAGNL